MNFNYYIYGTPKGNYCQWPNDHTSEFLSQQCNNVQGTQALIHRKGSLFFYALTERLEDGETIGIALAFRGTQSLRPLGLLALLRHVLDETMPSRGIIVRFDVSGRLHYIVDSLSDISEECQWIGDYLGQKIDELSNLMPFGLPNVGYDGRDTQAEVNMDSIDDGSVLRLTEKNNTLVLLSDAGRSRNYMSKIIYEQSEKIAMLENACQEKDVALKKTIQQKNQYRTVFILVVVMLIGTITAAYVIWRNQSTISSLEDNNAQLNVELTQKKEDIRRHQMHIAKLQDTVVSQTRKILQMSNSLEENERTLSRYRSLMHVVGMPSVNNNLFDEGSSMWLYAEVPVEIESFGLRAQSPGYANIVLHDREGKYLASESVYVHTSFSQKKVNLKIPSAGYYYLTVETRGMRLQYDSINRNIYRAMGSGPLSIRGCCRRGKQYYSAHQDYYSYFYNIKYRVLL